MKHPTGEEFEAFDAYLDELESLSHEEAKEVINIISETLEKEPKLTKAIILPRLLALCLLNSKEKIEEIMKFISDYKAKGLQIKVNPGIIQEKFKLVKKEIDNFASTGRFTEEIKFIEVLEIVASGILLPIVIGGEGEQLYKEFKAVFTNKMEPFIITDLDRFAAYLLMAFVMDDIFSAIITSGKNLKIGWQEFGQIITAMYKRLIDEAISDVEVMEPLINLVKKSDFLHESAKSFLKNTEQPKQMH